MLDAFIIDRIRQQQQNRHRESVQTPLRIEVPDLDPVRAPEHRPEPKREDEERGVVIIDFSI